jgi:ectoine hydroxylase-related dioxygenase (phytanoyl-CoA dioxygenase family)
MSFATEGYAIIESVLLPATIAALIELLSSSSGDTKRRGGTRNLLDYPEIRALAASPAVRALVDPILGPEAFPVRGILFDKTEISNWLVPWHQDVTIAVTERIETEGFGPWSIKQGITHVQPTAAILEQMLSVRLHLDPCPRENGALRVLPATHTAGKLSQPAIDTAVQTIPPIDCEVAIGGALIMRPLLLHASSASTIPGHRRVIHLDYAATQLPSGLRWAEAP